LTDTPTWLPDGDGARTLWRSSRRTILARAGEERGSADWIALSGTDGKRDELIVVANTYDFAGGPVSFSEMLRAGISKKKAGKKTTRKPAPRR